MADIESVRPVSVIQMVAVNGQAISMKVLGTSEFVRDEIIKALCAGDKVVWFASPGKRGIDDHPKGVRLDNPGMLVIDILPDMELESRIVAPKSKLQ